MANTIQPNIELVREMSLKYRNWGKWGPDEEPGSLNYATDEMRAKAATLVRRGKVFSLASRCICNPLSGGV